MVQINRRDFAKGAMGLFGWGMFAGGFGGCSLLSRRTGPNLVFGAISDIHIRLARKDGKNTFAGAEKFRETLEWFRDQGVDGVTISGDLAECGFVEELEEVGRVWRSVFPDDKAPDGRHVERLFVYGNHDWEGFNYGNAAEKLYPDAAERAKHVLQKDMAGWWEKAFHEPYAPIYSKEIKGYTFIGAHWDMGGYGPETGKKVYAFGRIADFMSANGKKIDPALPFFYVQHPHPKDTCYGSWAWGHDKGIVTKTLSAYSNAVAFSGHSHYSLTDERSIWQGAFTSVGTSSLRYTGIPTREFVPQGFENGSAFAPDAWKRDAMKGLAAFKSGDCRQGMLWSVYDDHIAVKRREFLSNLDIGEEWVMPLPSAEPRPFAFAEHAKKMNAPQFPTDAELEITIVKAKNRGGKSPDGTETIPSLKKPSYKVVVPPVIKDAKARLFTLEFTAEAKNGEKKTKLLLPEGFNHALGHEKNAMQHTCYFRIADLGKGEVRFTVTPVNCFGARGRPLTATFTPGKKA